MDLNTLFTSWLLFVFCGVFFLLGVALGIFLASKLYTHCTKIED